jgi:trehalose synthase
MALVDVEVPLLDTRRFDSVLTAEGAAQFARTIRRGNELLAGRTFWNVNSTARGGGVAEMLRSLIGYARGAGVDARWVVIEGDADFFDVTKRLHNRLHGVEGPALGDREREAYEHRCEANAELLAARLRPDDVVLLHDPQTAGMIPRLLEAGVPVIWRAHIGLDMPNETARSTWRFLMPYVERASAWVFSRLDHVWEGLDPQRITVIPPSIDAFSPKNYQLSFASITAVLRAAGLAADHHHPFRAVFQRIDGSTGSVTRAARIIEEEPMRLDSPLVAQVSRWDRLKDPIGVLQAFAEHVHGPDEPHLVIAGPDVFAVTDDPEGADVLEETVAVLRELPQRIRRRVHLALLPMDDADENAVIVNALQRRADVVVQKSLAEGFGLTVSEAMWKARPVVATDVGGIRDQIEDGVTGRLVDPRDLRTFGDLLRALLDDPYQAERMGEAAQLRVRDRFLGPRHLGQYVDLLDSVLSGRGDAPPVPAAHDADG